jgi:flagellar biosynthesis regulator FlaF
MITPAITDAELAQALGMRLEDALGAHRLAAQATELVERVLGRTIVATSRVQTQYIVGEFDALRVPGRPVRSVTIEYSTDAQTWTSIDAVTYVIDAQAGLVMRAGGYWSPGWYRITATVGIAADINSVPKEIRAAIISAARWIRTREAAGEQAFGPPDVLRQQLGRGA